MAVGMKKADYKLSGNLSAYLSDTATSIDVNNPPTEYPTYLTIEPDTDNEEIVKVTNVSGNTLTIVRGQGGTSAKEHQNGSAYEQRIVHLFQNENVDTFAVEHSETDGTHKTFTSPKISTSINDANGNEWIEQGATASAVNQAKISNAATGNAPVIEAAGDDSNISLILRGKNTFVQATGLYDNGNSGATATIDWSKGDRQKITLTDNVTFTFSNAVAGQILTLIMVEDATGGRTITWPTIKWSSGSEPSWGTGANDINTVTIMYDGTNYLGQGGTNYV